MNHSQKFLVTILFWLSIFSGITYLSGQDEKPKKGIMPLHPEKLFTLLPSKVEGWKLKQSKGWMGESVWIESSVTREFEQITDKAKPDQKPGVTRLDLLDTARFKGSELDLFSSFKPVKTPRYECKILDGHKAMIFQGRSGKTMGRFLIEDRWILTISVQNQPADSLKKWFDNVNVRSLKSVKDGPLIEAPESLATVTINELDPSANSNYLSEGSLSEIPEEEVNEEDIDNDDSSDGEEKEESTDE